MCFCRRHRRLYSALFRDTFCSMWQHLRVNVCPVCHYRIKDDVLIIIIAHREAVVLRLIHIAGQVGSVHPQKRIPHFLEWKTAVGASPRSKLSSSAAEIAGSSSCWLRQAALCVPRLITQKHISLPLVGGYRAPLTLCDKQVRQKDGSCA